MDDSVDYITINAKGNDSQMKNTFMKKFEERKR